MTTRLLGVSAALVDGVLLHGDVEVTDDVVTRVGLPPAPGGRIAAPGYVDLQVNGFAGVDVMAADVDGLRELSRALTAYGVTSWLPTLITADPADTERALGVLARGDRGRDGPRRGTTARRAPRGSVPQPGSARHPPRPAPARPGPRRRTPLARARTRWSR